MNQKFITIVVDGMGGDGSPYKVLKGSEIFLQKKNDVKIIFLGNQSIIKETIEKKKISLNNYSILHTDNNINDDDSVSVILRNRKDSSIKKGLELIKNLNSSGFVSAGNTAAIMTLSKLTLGMIEGIDRPAICASFPNKKDFSIILDLGANINSEARNLLQFAIMGFCFHSIIKPNTNPKLSIINIGTEENKGKEQLQECMGLINKSFLKDYFIGFIEADKITSGISDIMITDGFTGNMILKTAEGLSNYIMTNLKSIFLKSLKNKIAYKLIENDLNILRDNINPEKYDGAMLLGVNGISIKSHGSSNPYAFSHAIERCYKFIKHDINSKIRNELNKI